MWKWSDFKGILKFNVFTATALFFIAAVFVYYTIGNIGWVNALSWDAFGYYYYLPMVFIQKTISLENLDLANQIFENYNPSSTLYQFTLMPDGRYIIRYTSGQAILYLPFFAIGHLMALLSDYPADGFSKPYNVSILLGGLFYHFMAFVFISRILSKLYADKIVAVTLVILFFGTNAFSLLAGTALSSQGSVLFLVALFILIVDSYFRKKSSTKIFFAGCIFGLICINRPTDFITIVPALLWPAAIPGLSVKTEISTLFRRSKHLLLFIGAMSFFALIQFGYWKYAGGSWFINSYGYSDEGLDFLTPYTIPFLFSFRSGWFLYTPIMAIVFIFLIVQTAKKYKLMGIVLIYTCLFIYIASSWTNWWYASGFSQRAMVQAYALLSIPLAAVISRTFFSKSKMGVFGAVVIFLLALFSQWQTYQYHQGVIPKETSTGAYYFASFFDTNPDPSKKHLQSIDRYEYYIQGVYDVPDNYVLEDSREINIENDSLNLEGIEFSPAFKIPYRDITRSEHCFLVLTAVFQGELSDNFRLVSTFDYKGDSYRYRAYNANETKIDSSAAKDTFTSQIVYLSPNIRNQNDTYSGYIWNMYKEPGVLKSLKLDIYVKPED